MKIPSLENDFRTIFHSMPGIGIIVLPDSPHFTIEDVTNDLLKFIGINKEEILGKKLFEVFLRDAENPGATGSQTLRSSFQQVLATKQKHETGIARYDVRNSNGNFDEFYWHAVNTPILDNSGNVKFILFNSLNVTEHIINKREATPQRENFENHLNKDNAKQVLNQQAYNLFMQAPVGFSLLRGDDHIVELVNEMALRFTGKKEDSVGSPVIQVLPQIGAQGYIALLDRVKKEGEFVNLKESPFAFTKDGEERIAYLNVFFKPYYENEKIEGVLAVFIDVTEQVGSRKKVEQMGEQFETMANNIPNLAWIANADGWIYWYNNRWYEYTGTTSKDMEGWGWQAVHDPKKLPVVLEKWQQSILEGEPFEMVFPIKGADEIFHPFLTRVVPIRDNAGKIIRWLGTNTDITRQKEVERMKDEFIAIASHELKTPLTTIKAYGQIAEDMLREKKDMETLEMMKRMSSQVNKLNTLIEDLLDVTKIQKGKLVYHEDLFDFNDLLNEVINDMQRITVTHRIEARINTKVQVYGDKNKIGQVIDNLISNAIKYSPKANRIVITSNVKEEGIELCVQDFGIGILAKDRRKIFTQFYRVSGDDEMTFPGMGIGLYICQEIMARHGGNIRVESKIGKGSTFLIGMPFDYRENPSK